MNKAEVLAMADGRPLTGAWIETSARMSPKIARSGRPLTGAWIETQ